MTMQAASDLQWTTIDDFSPGIYSAPGYGFAGGLQAPPGAAQSADTFRCVPAANGKGLGPGPGYSSTVTMPVAILAEATGITSTGFYITGFQAYGLQPTVTSYLVGFNYRVSTPTRRQKVVSLDNGANYLITTISGVGCIMGIGFAPTRMNPTTPYITPGNPTMGCSVMSDQIAGNRILFVFPNPTAPGNNTLNFTVGIGGNILGHQGRLVVLVDNAYTVNGGGGSQLFMPGEEISFSDPVNSNTFPATLQQQIFWPENLSGYGAWGSLTAGSLLLIKRAYGAVLVEGDIAAPRVTNLPGVQGTGNIVTDAGVTQLGVAYIADRNGLFVWDGGAGSKKISTQLQDYFYREGSLAAGIDVTGTDSGTIIPGSFGGPTVQTLQWHDYIMVSGNWMYHIPTGGWWRLDDISTASGQRDHLFYRQTSLPFQLAASLVRTSGTTATQNIANIYSSIVPATSWSWHSHPIRVSNDEDVELSELILVGQRDTSATGTSTFTVTIYNQDGTTQSVTPWTVTASARPDHIRLPVSGIGSHLEFKIVAANSSTAPAPVLHSVAIGYRNLIQAPVG